MTLREKQSLFAHLNAELVLWIYAQGWEVTLADGSIDTPRFFRRGGRRFKGEDAHHMRVSLHYSRLAQDLNLFVGGEYIMDGSHPAWVAVGEHWEAMHELCAWGGRWQDANHFSLRHEGRA